MGYLRYLSCVLILIFSLTRVNSSFFSPSISSTAVKKAPRWNWPWLGLGVWCNGCPPRACDDDEAVVHGYCCGCAHPLDSLPVLCPQFLQCPLNAHGLCHDYEYMMRCCC